MAGSMTEAEQQLLESLARLTHQRNKKALAEALVDSLASYLECQGLILLDLPANPESDDYLQVAAALPCDFQHGRLQSFEAEHGEGWVYPDQAIQRCIASQQALRTQQSDGSPRTLFPIMVEHRLQGVLDLYGHACTPDSQRLIHGLLQIYTNLLAIIRDGEHDTLTGLLNRKAFDTHLAELLSSLQPEHPQTQPDNAERRLPKGGRCHWLGIMDVDHFKTINDSFGHVYGDEVLLLFAELMKHSFRNRDLLFRYGGEEFVVVLTPGSEEDAQASFERFRQRLEFYHFPQIGKVTVSIGMVRIDPRQHSSTLLSCADQALYYAKQHGRNQVCNYHALVAEDKLQVRRIENDIELFE